MKKFKQLNSRTFFSKCISYAAAGALLAGCLAGCASGNGQTASGARSDSDINVPSVDASQKEADAGLQIVTTIFPEYDWVREILGENPGNAEVTMLLDNGVDLHSYQPTAQDILKISTCDLFVYVGGESDEWVEDALEEATNKDMIVINLLEVLGESVKEEEIVEGMEHDHDHEHEEIEESDIKDRSLAEFKGEWKSLLPLLESGDLDEYVEHHAEEHGEPQAEVKEELAEKWSCEAEKIKIDGDQITFTYADGKSMSAKYTYAGYLPVKDEDGDITGVRYQFETASAEAPKFVQFNDHGHEPAEEVEHFHIYFGNESFDALAASETNPFFVPEVLDADAVLEELMGGHDHEHEEGEGEYDEHVWLSLKNASVLCDSIKDALTELDAANAAVYEANAESYKKQLAALDADYQAAVKSAAVKTVLFGDRFPFRYMTDDYGLSYYAAFAGCSAETEASFETIIFLAGKVDELGLPTILKIESGDGKIAETIKNNTKTKDQKILTMDSMQSTTSKDVAAGKTYAGIMTENLQVLREALNQ